MRKMKKREEMKKESNEIRFEKQRKGRECVVSF